MLPSNGTEIVKYFGWERDVPVPVDVEVLQKSNFESCNHVAKVVFENGSKQRIIGSSAHCQMIEKAAFKGCNGL
jgi:hypothetical protein